MAAIEIDAAKLPQVCVLDTGVLLLSLAQKVHRPDTAVCRALWKALLDKGRLAAGARILIPAPAIAEVLRGASQQDPPRITGVFVAPFTARTARYLGKYLSTSFIEATVTATQVPRAYIKYDAMIAATAMAYDATLIALDGWFHRQGPSWPIRVAKPDDFRRAQLTLGV